MEKTGINNYKLHRDRFHIRNNFFFLVRTNHWNNPPIDVLEPSLLEVFNTQLDRVLQNLVLALFLMQDWTT